MPHKQNRIAKEKEMSQESTVFIGNLDPGTNADQAEALLYELFSQCGVVQSIRIPNDGGKTKGFAFLEMSSTAAATYATLAINGIRLNGRTLRVACAFDDDKDRQIRLDNLPFDIDEIDLYEALSQKIGIIRGVSIRRNHTGRSEGKATVWLDSVEAAQRAKEMLSAKTLYLDALPLRIAA